MAKYKSLVRALLAEKKLTKKKVELIKRKWAKKQGINLPLSSDILKTLTPAQKKKLRKVLVTKPAKTISGVSVIAIMAKPAPCPGNCSYCPKGSEAPQSYTGHEPATMRARRNKYDPYKQVKNRLNQLEAVGHSTDKNELIIMGGTFPALPWKYQKQFVKRAFDAFNRQTSKTLRDAHKKNETAKRRVVGLTIETRPDHLDINKLLKLGTTRVEIGVQTVYDKILEGVMRGHNTEETIIATRMLKDAGLKVLYHMMPNLPGSNSKKDERAFKKIFKNKKFKPDMLKIYPTLVIKGTKLYDVWKAGKYKAMTDKQLFTFLKKVMDICPEYVRIMRIQRDIPANFIEAGPTKSNMRQEVDKTIKKSKEIRFREAGHVFLRTKKTPKKISLNVKKYKASKGTEYFISVEDKKQNILLGFLRLRLPPEQNIAFVRELHVYGKALPIGARGEIQHSGWGKMLMVKAEELTKKNKRNKLLVTSGIGVREYYRKLGYKLKDPYMSKLIS
ncbi:tRNA uridine(34) 5-carboxymethylaminomethyl modification radical SAM/GNAT enzyme Elp3 [Candidatus Woesearchaeota archaeon]|nr:tRNA uridine(34) 5-carboxymethylaminomethyl modification radical SAM/GNAT enzyme Elp3 [Candidatus Woesearchaeota archaeon]